MIQSGLFPTNFARKLADGVGLEDDELEDVNQRLVNFQQMALGTSFEESLIAYHGTELTETQKEVLQVIYNSTAPWIKGHVTGVLMTRLTESKLSISAAEMVLEIIRGEGGIDNGKLSEIIVDLEL